MEISTDLVYSIETVLNNIILFPENDKILHVCTFPGGHNLLNNNTFTRYGIFFSNSLTATPALLDRSG